MNYEDSWHINLSSQSSFIVDLLQDFSDVDFILRIHLTDGCVIDFDKSKGEISIGTNALLLKEDGFSRLINTDIVSNIVVFKKEDIVK